MFCRYCGSKLNSTNECCDVCGKKLQTTSIQLHKKFSIEELLQFGWNVFKANPWASILIIAIILLPSILPNTKIGIIIATLLFFFSQLWLTKIALSVPDDTFKFNKKLFFSKPSNSFNFLGASILNFIIVFSGMALFLLPGVYLSIRFSLVSFIIIDEQCSIIESFKRSWSLTSGYEFKIFKWLIVSTLVIVIGFISLVGWIVIIPVIIYSEYYLYKKLKYGK